MELERLHLHIHLEGKRADACLPSCDDDDDDDELGGEGEKGGRGEIRGGDEMMRYDVT
jgi:hypothetical protein